MPGDIIFIHQIDKIPLGIARQGGLTKVRVRAQISGGLNIQVGEVTATATGH